MLSEKKLRAFIFKPCAITLIIAFVLNDVSFARSNGEGTMRPSTLSQTSRFKPIAMVSTRSLRDDTAFLYLNLLIARFLADAERLSRMGMSSAGLRQRLEELKASIGRDPGHIDFLALSAHKMYAPFGSGGLISAGMQRRNARRLRRSSASAVL
jgi:hypothetical protein